MNSCIVNIVTFISATFWLKFFDEQVLFYYSTIPTYKTTAFRARDTDQSSTSPGMIAEGNISRLTCSRTALKEYFWARDLKWRGIRCKNCYLLRLKILLYSLQGNKLIKATTISREPINESKLVTLCDRKRRTVFDHQI
jgi:hypothetical protein